VAADVVVTGSGDVHVCGGAKGTVRGSGPGEVRFS